LYLFCITIIFGFFSKTMPETGVSRLVGVKLDEVEEV
jgi:hypothetical protein